MKRVRSASLSVIRVARVGGFPSDLTISSRSRTLWRRDGESGTHCSLCLLRLRKPVTLALPLAMLRLLVVYAAVLCAFPGAAALARSSASDTGSRLPECVLFLRCSCKLCC